MRFEPSPGTALPMRDWRAVAPRPRVCPIAAALGETRPCNGERCAYFEIPGVPATCAIEHWAPDVENDPDLARWYLERAADHGVAAAA
jgi:hypothetical protein